MRAEEQMWDSKEAALHSQEGKVETVFSDLILQQKAEIWICFAWNFPFKYWQPIQIKKKKNSKYFGA